MVSILCSSPLHIMIAFALKREYYENKDVSILLMDYSANAIDVKNNIEKTGYFCRVDLINGKEIWKRYCNVQDKLYKVYFLKFGIKHIKKKNIPWREIDEILFPYHDPFVIMLSKHIAKVNGSVSLKYYDDGVASYMNTSYIITNKPSRLEVMLHVPRNLYKPDAAYLFSPELTEVRDVITTCKITFPQDEGFVNVLNGVFGYTHMSPRPVIFFDQLVFKDFTDDDKRELRVVSDFLNDHYEKKDVYIKKHPKRNGDYYERNGWDIFPEKTQVPFELCILNNSNINDITLVTDCSTACITPALLFGYQPRVVFLYKKSAFLSEKDKKEFEKVIMLLKNIYIDSTKIEVEE